MVEHTPDTVAAHFRTAIRRERNATHIVDRLILQPLKSRALGCARTLAEMHHGHINAYTAYVLAALIVTLAVGFGLAWVVR